MTRPVPPSPAPTGTNVGRHSPSATRPHWPALVGHDPTLAVALAVWLTDIVIRAGRLLTITRSNDRV